MLEEVLLLRLNDLILLFYLSDGDGFDIEDTLLWKLLSPLFGLIFIAYVVYFITDLLSDVFEFLFIYNILIYSALTIAIIYFNYLIIKERNAEKKITTNVKSKNDPEKIHEQQIKLGKLIRTTLILIGISALIGYMITFVIINGAIFSDYFFYKGKYSEGFGGTFFNFIMFFLFIVIDEFIKLILLLIGQLVLLFLSTPVITKKIMKKEQIVAEKA